MLGVHVVAVVTVAIVMAMVFVVSVAVRVVAVVTVAIVMAMVFVVSVAVRVVAVVAVADDIACFCRSSFSCCSFYSCSWCCDC